MKLRASAPPAPQPDMDSRPSSSWGPTHSGLRLTPRRGSADPLTVTPNFSGFDSSSEEEGELRLTPPRASVLLQSAKALGPPDSVSEDIDQQVASMVNFLFEKGMQEEDYKAVSEDQVTRRPGICPALTPVECNPQILGALKTDAKKADFWLKDVSGDIQMTGTIFTRSLLALGQLVQVEGNAVIEREVTLLNPFSAPDHDRGFVGKCLLSTIVVPYLTSYRIKLRASWLLLVAR